MNAAMTIELADQATATAALAKVRKDLDDAQDAANKAMDELRTLIRTVRPTGVLTVDQMAEAVEHDRNYIDSVWSSAKETTQGRQTRVRPSGNAGDAAKVSSTLFVASRAQRSAAATVPVARAERNRVVSMVYASKIMGPSAIAAVVGIDRNHVLRIARKSGIEPQHRSGSRNQHSK